MENHQNEEITTNSPKSRLKQRIIISLFAVMVFFIFVNIAVWVIFSNHHSYTNIVEVISPYLDWLMFFQFIGMCIGLILLIILFIISHIYFVQSKRMAILIIAMLLLIAFIVSSFAGFGSLDRYELWQHHSGF